MADEGPPSVIGLGLSRFAARRRATPPEAPPAPRPRGGRMLALGLGAASVAATILAASAGLVWEMRERAFRDASGNIEKINLVLAEHSARTLQGIDLLLGDLIRETDAQGFDGAEQFRARMSGPVALQSLRQRISGVPLLDSLSLVDAKGDIVNQTGSTPAAPANLADRDYFVALRDDPALPRFIGEPVQNRATGRWTVFLARRIQSRDGAFLGLALGAIALGDFEGFYRQIYFGDNTAVSLWRSDGTLLARYPQAAALTGRPVPSALRNLTRLLGGADGQSGTGRIMGNINPTPLLLTARRVPGYPLFTTISVPESAILAPWRRTAASIMAGGFLISIAIGVIAWLLSKRFAVERRAAEARSQRDEATAALHQVEAVSRAKSEFLAHMSHELRTPLNAIIGFAEVMRDELMGPLGSSHYKGYAQDICMSGKTLLGIVSDALDFSQANAGRLTIEQRVVDLPGLIASVAGMFRVELDRAGLQFSCDIEAGLPVVIGDEKRIRQVLVNLVGNAIKFNHPGGKLRIVARAVGTSVELRVEDTGIGISAENLVKLFQPFGFLDLPQLARKNRGAGLGLPICKKLVELLGGTLALASTLDAGTVATVTLPVAYEARPGIPMAAE